jgi:hypothetical protein
MENLMKHLSSAVFALALATAVTGADASVVLVTSDAGYSGPVVDLSGFPGFYTFGNGPTVLPGGITFEAVGTNFQGGSVIGSGGYGFGGNGTSFTTTIIGSNSPFGFVELAFGSAISSFGGFFNYLPDLGSGDNPFIAAYDAMGGLLGSFDLSVLAPISTPGGQDVFAFRGIESDGTDIASIRFGGAYIAFAPTAAATVPVPAALPLLLLALGGLGIAGRRRKTPSV